MIKSFFQNDSTAMHAGSDRVANTPLQNALLQPRPAQSLPLSPRAPRRASGFAALSRLLASACIALGLVGISVDAVAAPLDTMIKAVKFNDVSAVRKMLTKGVDPNAVDDQGIPLLVIAAREKSNDVALILMNDKRIDLQKEDKAGENAMMLAAIEQDAPLVQALIAKGAEVNKKGWTPLHYAASSGDDDIVKMLLDASAYIDAGSPNGTTPMMMAARAGHVSTIDLLVSQGADPTIKNQLGMTAQDFAKRYAEKDAITALATQEQAWNAQHAGAAASGTAASAASHS